jgi:hypothetical protein
VIKPGIIIAADGGNSIFHKYVDKQVVKENRVAYGVTGKDFISRRLQRFISMPNSLLEAIFIS